MLQKSSEEVSHSGGSGVIGDQCRVTTIFYQTQSQSPSRVDAAIRPYTTNIINNNIILLINAYRPWHHARWRGVLAVFYITVLALIHRRWRFRHPEAHVLWGGGSAVDRSEP